MLYFEINITDRKKLLRRLEKLTGSAALYLNPPSYAYQIGDYTLDREGNVSVEEEKADTALLMQLMGEGLLKEKAITSLYGELTPVRVSIELPLKGHNGASVRNLFNMIHSRAALLNKATGSDFYVARELCDLLAENGNAGSIEVLKKVVKDYTDLHKESLRGIAFTKDRILLTGFPEYRDNLTCSAYKKLAQLMDSQARRQKRIQAKEVPVESERYSFRIWLVRLGMRGDEYKHVRRILLKDLEGHTAFRSAEEQEIARRKALQKRKEEKERRSLLDRDEKKMDPESLAARSSSFSIERKEEGS